jgi:hypothetical protein
MPRERDTICARSGELAICHDLANQGRPISCLSPRASHDTLVRTARDRMDDWSTTVTDPPSANRRPNNGARNPIDKPTALMDDLMEH